MGLCIGNSKKIPASPLSSWRLNGFDWVETTDPETNHTYYVCPQTGESRITLPRNH